MVLTPPVVSVGVVVGAVVGTVVGAVVGAVVVGQCAGTAGEHGCTKRQCQGKNTEFLHNFPPS